MNTIRPLFMTSHGPVEFACPHVDKRKQEDIITSWTYSARDDDTDHAYTLIGLHTYAGHSLPPPQSGRTMGTDGMISLPDTNLTTSLIYFSAFMDATRRLTKNFAVAPGGMRIHCTRDLFVMDLRRTSRADDVATLPIRPLLSEIKSIAPGGGVKAVSGIYESHDAVLPIFDRAGRFAQRSNHEALRRFSDLEPQIEAIISLAQHPSERFKNPALIS